MTIEIPEHLEDLIETKPSSYEKLNEVFHELTIENQILILKYKIENHGGISYLEDEFYLNAIKSKNSYIRYLVAQYIGRTSLDDSETVKK